MDLSVEEIIDIHSHLGNILYPNGGKLICCKGLPDRSLFDTGFKFRNLFDAGFYAALFKYRHGGKQPNALVRAWGTWSNRNRNAVATLENMQKSLDASGVSKSVVLPIAPYVTFDDICDLGDERLICFTSADFDDDLDVIERKLDGHVSRGARGLKLHPIIQKVSLDDPKTYDVVEMFSKHNLPILFHSGVTTYYFGDEKKKERPENGGIVGARKLMAAFDNVNFIVGHAGGIGVDEVISTMAGYENAYVDTSFQSPEKISELINVFGSKRVLFASDWPYGDRKVSINIMKEACDGDYSVMRDVFNKNAKYLMRL
jgi:uncharacterized protein